MKYVRLFTEGNRDQKDLLGGKGANLAEMTNLGLPVPPGFTITTEACIAFIKAGNKLPEGLMDQVRAALAGTEEATGKRFGDPERPLLVSVRSGAKFSMPGMMDTILDLGLNEETLRGLIAATGDERFGYDSWRRFIMMFGDIVMDIERRKFDKIFQAEKERSGVATDAGMPAEALRATADRFLALFKEEAGRDFPSDPMEQLELAIRAVFSSWNNERAIHYRRIEKIPDDLGTAVNVQSMVFGNMGDDSGSGVAFTRDPVSGEKKIWGEYLPNAQGEDVVAGIRTPLPVAQLAQDAPEIYQNLLDISKTLEQHYRDVMDIEFTIERGRLHMLQCRAGKRSTRAAVRCAVDMVREGLIDERMAVLRVDPNRLGDLLHPQLDPLIRVESLSEIPNEIRQNLQREYNGKGKNGGPVMVLTMAQQDLAHLLGKGGSLPLGDLKYFTVNGDNGKNDGNGTEVAVWQIELPKWQRMEEPRRKAVLADSRFVQIGTGLGASPGAASGIVVFDPERAVKLAGRGEDVILVRQETSPDDVHGMTAARGVLTQRGGMSSHAALVARGFGIPCVAGCVEMAVDESARKMTISQLVVYEGQAITIDGSTGKVLLGHVPLTEASLLPELAKLISLADRCARDEGVSKLDVRANADTPADASVALEFGAQGIGLCRTEHMFLQPERLPLVRKMILAAAEAKRLEMHLEEDGVEIQKAHGQKRGHLETRIKELQRQLQGPRHDYLSTLKELLPMQLGDFIEIFRIMDGLPVCIRLLDPPMHEFLPNYEELFEDVEQLKHAPLRNRKVLQAKAKQLQQVRALRETNPMLGLRGCRLGILYPEVVEMQVRAIFRAATTAAKDGVRVQPEIMIPLVGFRAELKRLRDQLEDVARETMVEAGINVPYQIGTMIELPRAALTAGEIAKDADFFSFGTNDLTQTTLGISRDDAEARFLTRYLDWGILPDNPFETIDQAGVGQLIRIAVEAGRRTRPDLKIGICGEHGGDPRSVDFCHRAGLDYVSCSPYRVPIARLAAAHAALQHDASERDR